MKSNPNRLLVLNGSPVRGSNVDLISEEIARGAATNGWIEQRTYLNDYVITPCQACGAREDDDICIYHDDIYPLFDLFSNCDAVVAASPMYFDSVSAQIKLFIDRCNCYRPLKISEDGEQFIFKRKWKKRKGIIVLVGGEREKYRQAATVIRGFFVWTGVEFIDSLFYAHTDWEIGSVKNDKGLLKRAFELGRAL